MGKLMAKFLQVYMLNMVLLFMRRVISQKL